MTTKTILVEARKDINVKPILDEIASTCVRSGYRVKRWRGPLSGRVPYRRRLPDCELAILFNGTHQSYATTMARLKRTNTPLLYVELGWYPQQGTFQIDTDGINAEASWVSQPLSQSPGQPLPVKSSGDLLVILQDDGDTQITHRSPWFADMQQFVMHIGENSEMPIRVRFHPRHRPSAGVMNLIAKNAWAIDTSPTLGDALASCRAVACVNSSSGVEALAKRIPVLCHGEAIYRHRGAVYCLTNCGESTRTTTRNLARGKCSLFENLVDELVNRIQQQQRSIADIPKIIPAVVEMALKSADSAVQSSVSFGLKTDGLRFRKAS